MKNHMFYDGDVTPSEPISTIIFSGGQGSLRTDTVRRIRPLGLSHTYMTAMSATPHDTVRKSVTGTAGTTTVELTKDDFAGGVCYIPLVLIKITTQKQFAIPNGAIQANVIGKTEASIDITGGTFDVLRGEELTNFGVIPVVLVESGKYAVPVSIYVSPDQSATVEITGTTPNDTVEVLIPGPGANEAIAILSAAGLAGLVMDPTS